MLPRARTQPTMPLHFIRHAWDLLRPLAAFLATRRPSEASQFHLKPPFLPSWPSKGLPFLKKICGRGGGWSGICSLTPYLQQCWMGITVIAHDIIAVLLRCTSFCLALNKPFFLVPTSYTTHYVPTFAITRQWAWSFEVYTCTKLSIASEFVAGEV